MAEYCLQCAETIVDAGFLTPVRNGPIVCEGCGSTIVDNKGRCTGGCGTDAHNGIMTDYIFETSPPSFYLIHPKKYTWKTILYKVCVDIAQCLPRIVFWYSMAYLLCTAVILRYCMKLVSEKSTIRAEIAFSKANRWYTHSLDVWYKTEMKIEEFLFH